MAVPNLCDLLSSKAREVFGIDVRTLAALRIGLAVVVLRDLSIRAADLELFYADSGVLPRRDLLDFYPEDYFFCLHLLSGLWQVQALLFGVAAVFGIMLLFGYRTRLATVASWFLLSSLQYRNPLVGHSGDTVLRVLLFWSMFLPLGASYSLDRVRDSSAADVPRTIFSPATFALLLQVASIYLFSALFKTDPIWRSDGTAVWYALSIEALATELGRWLLNYPDLLRFLTFATLYLEFCGPLVPFIPFWNAWFRMAALLAFVSFHLGLILTLGLGIFPYACWVAWSAFLPSGFWDFWERRLATPARTGLTLRYDERHDLCRRLLACYRTFVLFSWPSLRPVDAEHATMPGAAWWAVRATDGKEFASWEGVVFLFRQAPFLFRVPFELLTWGPLSRWAAGCYVFLAERSAALERWLFFLRPAPLVLRTRFYHVGRSLVLLLLLLTIAWNLRSIDPEFWSMAFKDRYNFLVAVPRLDQNWSMFAPYPLREDGWYVVEARLQDGSVVNLLTGAPATDEKPPLISATYPNERVQKYMLNLWGNDHRRARFPYLQYQYRRWQETHAGDPQKQIKEIKMYFWVKLNTYGAAPQYRKVEVGDFLPSH